MRTATIIIGLGIGLAGVAGCGGDDSDGGSGATSITCDEYSQKPYGPEGIGSPGRTSDVTDLLEAHGLDGYDTSLHTQVERAITKYCGRTSLEGGENALRNNGSPIDNAVDWDSLGATQ